jgi:GntP family gluconate:H+ symporter
VIILITAAGGAFGAMLKHSGLGGELEKWGAESGPVMILLAFGVAAIMKTAQGSGTVSIVTTSGIMFALLQGKTLEVLPYHPIYIFLAIGFGSKAISWMNDSGFWVVCKLSGFTEKETLRTWTVLLAFLAGIGLVEVLLFSTVLPLKFLSWSPGG